MNPSNSNECECEENRARNKKKTVEVVILSSDDEDDLFIIRCSNNTDNEQLKFIDISPTRQTLSTEEGLLTIESEPEYAKDLQQTRSQCDKEERVKNKVLLWIDQIDENQSLFSATTGDIGNEVESEVKQAESMMIPSVADLALPNTGPLILSEEDESSMHTDNGDSRDSDYKPPVYVEKKNRKRNAHPMSKSERVDIFRKFFNTVSKYPSMKERKSLANETGVETVTVRNWFICQGSKSKTRRTLLDSNSANTFKKKAYIYRRKSLSNKLRKAKSRHRFNSKQLEILRSSYSRLTSSCLYPDKFEKCKLVEQTGLSELQISTWFVNERRKKATKRIYKGDYERFPESELIQPTLIDPEMPILEPQVPLNITLEDYEDMDVNKRSKSPYDGVPDADSKSLPVRVSQSQHSEEAMEKDEKVLEDFFVNVLKGCSFPIPQEKLQLSMVTNLSIEAISDWFEQKMKTKDVLQDDKRTDVDPKNPNSDYSECSKNFDNLFEEVTISRRTGRPRTRTESNVVFKEDTESSVSATRNQLEELSLPNLKSIYPDLKKYFYKLMELYADDAIGSSELAEDSKCIQELIDFNNLKLSSNQMIWTNSMHIDFVEDNQEEIWGVEAHDDEVEDTPKGDDVVSMMEDFINDVLGPWCIVLLHGKVSGQTIQQVIFDLAMDEEKHMERRWSIPSVLDDVTGETNCN